MRTILVLAFVAFFSAACTQPKSQEEVFTVENVLLPLEPPLTPRSVQSRAIRALGPPFDDSVSLRSIRLLKAEIGNPDFPNLHFAKEIRFSLIDPDGKIIPLAVSGDIPPNTASIFLNPVGKPDLTRIFQQKKLDMLLEVDNNLTSDQGIMLIGSFKFAYLEK